MSKLYQVEVITEPMHGKPTTWTKRLSREDLYKFLGKKLFKYGSPTDFFIGKDNEFAFEWDIQFQNGNVGILVSYEEVSSVVPVEVPDNEQILALLEAGVLSK